MFFLNSRIHFQQWDDGYTKAVSLRSNLVLLCVQKTHAATSHCSL